MLNINVFSDFACPWCYIGEKRLEDAISRLGLNGDVRVWYRAFELDPNAPKEGNKTSAERIAEKYNLSLERAKNKVSQIDKVGQELGLNFNYSGAKPSNTFDAHRLMKLAEAQYDNLTLQKLNKGLFDAYFGKNLVLANPDVLKEVGVAAGIDITDIDNLLKSDQYKEEVINDENIAHNLGITGVPYIIIDNKVAIPGAVSTEDFMDALVNVSKNQNVNEEGESCSAMNCDENGCELK